MIRSLKLIAAPLRAAKVTPYSLRPESYLFLGGEEPAAPGPLECGAPAAPAAGCARYDSCK